MEFLGTGHRLRGRCRTRPDPHQSPRGHARSGDFRGHVPESRRSAAVPGVSRSHPRLRHLPLRPEETAFHQAALAAAVPGRRADRPRNPRHRQQRRRAAVDPGGHAGQAGPRRARLRYRQVQRLQHLLPAGGLGHLGRFLRLPGHRHPGTRGGAQCRRRHGQCLELLSTAGPREAGAGDDPGRQVRIAWRLAGGVPLHTVR